MSNVNEAATIAMLMNRIKELEAAKAKGGGADKPTTAALGTWTDKNGTSHDMVNITGNFRPISLSVNKARRLLECVPQIEAALAQYDAKQKKG